MISIDTDSVPNHPDTHPTSHFSGLSVELVLRIIHFAALPDFSPERKANPYASALALCLVSGAVRRIAMPHLLHTVILTGIDAPAKFVQALRIQRNYASIGHPFFIDYADYVCRLWVGEYVYPPSSPTPMQIRGSLPWHSSSLWRPHLRSGDVSLLAPVLLGAPSLGIDFQNLYLLCDCLKQAWQNQSTTATKENTNIDSTMSSIPPGTKLPWRTTTFTLLGGFRGHWTLNKTPQGSAFLASIPSLVFLDTPVHFRDIPAMARRSPDHIPRRLLYWTLYDVPWSDFRGLRNVIVPIPRNFTRYFRFKNDPEPPMYYPPAAKDIEVRILMVEAPSPGDPAYGTATEDWVKKAFHAYIAGEEHGVVDVEVGVQVWDQQVIFDWEACWANGFIG